jgi:hypothetical protein
MHPPGDRYRLLPYRTRYRYVWLSSRSCDRRYTDKAFRLCRPFSCPRGRFLPHGQSPSALRNAAFARLTKMASLTMSSPYSSVSGPSRSPTRRRLPKCTPTAYVLILSYTNISPTHTLPVATRRNPRSPSQRSLPRRPMSLHLP